jgi:hypothetical protein
LIPPPVGKSVRSSDSSTDTSATSCRTQPTQLGCSMSHQLLNISFKVLARAQAKPSHVVLINDKRHRGATNLLLACFGRTHLRRFASRCKARRTHRPDAYSARRDDTTGRSFAAAASLRHCMVARHCTQCRAMRPAEGACNDAMRLSRTSRLYLETPEVSLRFLLPVGRSGWRHRTVTGKQIEITPQAQRCLVQRNTARPAQRGSCRRGAHTGNDGACR